MNLFTRSTKLLIAVIATILLPLKLSGQIPDSIRSNIISRPDSLIQNLRAYDDFELSQSEELQNGSNTVNPTGTFDSYIFDFYNSQVVMPSYQSMSMIRDISIPVDYYTGRANISIPLYEIKTAHITVPIALSYQSSGIKVEDYETWVGLGWNLNPGGAVTRIVRGFPDEYGYSHPETPEGNFNLNVWKNDDYFKANYSKYDGQPDIFYFQIPGYSGAFVVDYHGNAHVMPYQNIKIEWVDKTYFKITDPYGNTYILGSAESSRELAKDVSKKARTDIDYHTSTWYLDRVVSSANYELVRFTYGFSSLLYETKYYDKYYEMEVKVSGESTFAELKKTEDIEIKTRIYPVYLEKIEWDGGYIDFISYINLEKRIKKLDKIEINTSSNNSLTKSIYFNFSTFTGGRWRLDSLDEVYNYHRVPLCSFSYNNNYNLPDRDSNDFDYWGYYSTMSVDPNHPFPHFRLPETGTLITNGINRASWKSEAEANILKRINYPNGSYREFTYELNKGKPLSQASEMNLGGLRIKSVKFYPRSGAAANEILTTSYEYSYGYAAPAYGAMADFLYSTRNIYGINMKNSLYRTDFNGVSVGYSQVKEILPNGSYNIYKYDSFALCNDTKGEIVKVNQSNHSWSIESNTDWVPRSSYFWKRGNLSELASYDSNGELITTSTYNYNYSTDDSIPSYYLFIQNKDRDNGIAWVPRLYVGRYYWHIERQQLSSIITRNKYGFPTTTTFSYNDKNLPIRIEVNETATGTTMITKNVYVGDVHVSGYYTNSKSTFAVKKMKEKDWNAYLLETITFRNNQTVSGEYMMYQIINDGVFPYRSYSLKMTSPLNYNVSNFPTTFFPSAGEMYLHADYMLDINYDTFDNDADVPVSFSGPAGQRSSIILGYNKTLKIAEVQNARHSTSAARENEVFHTSFEDMDFSQIEYHPCAKSGSYAMKGYYYIPLENFKPGTYIITYWESASKYSKFTPVQKTVNITSTMGGYTIGDPNKYIDEVRVMPKNATMVTYSYKEGIGVTSITDNNGLTTYYEYNQLGLLYQILDNDQNVIKKITYDDLNIPVLL